MTASPRPPGARPDSIPSSPAEITAAWLSSVMDEQFASVRVEPVGTGQTASTYRVTAESCGSTRTFIAKLPSQQQDVRERVALGYRAEHAFYTRAADTVSVPLPSVYYCDITTDASQFVLLMSDSAPATQGDQIRGCSEADALLAVEALAGLHGPRWCDPAWLSFEGVTMPKADADFARGMGELGKVALDAVLSGLGDRIGAADRETLTASAALFEPWLITGPDRFCLLHGDYRLDNLLFDPAESTVTVVDWQTITIGLPARDLAYFLGTSLSPDLRATTEHSLVSAYHHRLLAHGVTDYTRADCWTDYRLGMLQIPLLTTFGYAFAATTDRGDDAMLAMIHRGCQAIRSLQTLELIKTLD
ncbi:phosphotransferase family protein [Nocardia sp. NBC_00511]|uniref:phosphotransferase family protein n=1 Tax=Nocardia sp. NBC_00511 TaxID=2903591 RepID=UPI0030E4EDE2